VTRGPAAHCAGPLQALLQFVEALRALSQTLSGMLLLQALADPCQAFAEAV